MTRPAPAAGSGGGRAGGTDEGRPAPAAGNAAARPGGVDEAPGPGVARTVAETAGIAAFGLLASIGVGAVAVAGTEIVAPDLLGLDSRADVLARVVRAGLSTLRVPAGSGDVTGAVSPLTGAAVACAAIAWGVRSRRPAWPLSRPALVALLGAWLAALCVLAVAATGEATLSSAAGAIAAGLVWGSAGAFWGTPDRDAARRRAVRPALGVLVTAAGLAALWLTAVGIASVVTGDLSLRALIGAGLLVAAFAPNVLSAVVALACGARVEAAVVVSGGPVGTFDGVASWDWFGGRAPWYVLVLVALPLVAAAAGALLSNAPPLRRGLGNGLALGGTLLVVGWAGSYEAAADGASVRLGIELLPALLLGLAWGVAGSYVATWLPAGVVRPRVDRP